MMRDKNDNDPPDTPQAPPASPEPASPAPPISLREALERVSFEELKLYFHTGRIPVSHWGLYASPGGAIRSTFGDLPPAGWANARKDRAGRVFFFIEWVEDGRVIQEEVYVYDIDIRLDRLAFEMCFPAVTKPAKSDDMRTAQKSIPEQNVEAAFSASAASSPAEPQTEPLDIQTSVPAQSALEQSESEAPSPAAHPGTLVAAEREASAQGVPASQAENLPSASPSETDLTEQLTYAQLVDRLGFPSVDAARAFAKRHDLPRASGSDGKTRVTINFKEIHYQPRSTRSPSGDRLVAEPAFARSPGGDRPVAEGEVASPPSGEPKVESDALDSSVRPPSDTNLKAFVAAYIKSTTDSGEIPTKTGLWSARGALPGATRKRLFDEYEEQVPTLPPGRPRNNNLPSTSIMSARIDRHQPAISDQDLGCAEHIFSIPDSAGGIDTDVAPADDGLVPAHNPVEHLLCV